MFKKIVALGAAAALCAGLMTGCGASGTTADTSYSAENPLVLAILFIDLPRTLLAVGVVYALSGPGYWLWQRVRRHKDAQA